MYYFSTNLDRKEALSDNFTGVGNEHKGRRLYLAYVISKLECLAALHGGHDHGLLMMGEGPLGMIDGGAPVHRLDLDCHR